MIKDRSIKAAERSSSTYSSIICGVLRSRSQQILWRLLIGASALLTSFCSFSPARNQGSATCKFGPAQNLGPIVNSPTFDGGPTVSADETALFFTSSRNGQEDLFVSMRPDRQSQWGAAASLGDPVNDPIGDDFSLRLAVDRQDSLFRLQSSGRIRPGGPVRYNS